MSGYVRSKAIAEPAAWEFMRSEGGSLELTAVNPTGPVLGPDVSFSVELMTRFLHGMPTRHASLTRASACSRQR